MITPEYKLWLFIRLLYNLNLVKNNSNFLNFVKNKKISNMVTYANGLTSW